MHAVGYVLKPFEDARLRAALVRATASLHGTALANTLEALIASPLVDQRFEVRIGSRVMFVPWTQIDWIEGAGYYSTLHAGEDTHLVRETMQSLERRLDPARFLRVHRSAIVQLDRIRELRNGGSRIVLSTGRAIPVSRSRKGRLLDALGNPTRRRPASASE